MNFLPQKREKRETKVIESQPLSGNDVILPRSSYKEPGNGAITIVNILVGVVIGAALIWFLVMPSRYKVLRRIIIRAFRITANSSHPAMWKSIPSRSS